MRNRYRETPNTPLTEMVLNHRGRGWVFKRCKVIVWDGNMDVERTLYHDSYDGKDYVVHGGQYREFVGWHETDDGVVRGHLKDIVWEEETPVEEEYVEEDLRDIVEDLNRAYSRAERRKERYASMGDGGMVASQNERIRQFAYGMEVARDILRAVGYAVEWDYDGGNPTLSKVKEG